MNDEFETIACRKMFADVQVCSSMFDEELNRLVIYVSGLADQRKGGRP